VGVGSSALLGLLDSGSKCDIRTEWLTIN
jgi:hypothetical protein